ncbi:Uncharacterised protein [Mycobacteroides abscessus subsp. abscessus]|nr:Uncharacterised protein [Mycobacteroides abscessus subsp. abscessus]
MRAEPSVVAFNGRVVMRSSIYGVVVTAQDKQAEPE